MKKILTIILGVLVAITAITFDAEAQSSFRVCLDEELGDSTVFNFSKDKEVYKWSGFTIEVIYESMTVNDTTAAVELYSSLGYDFSDATNLDTGDALVGADGAGGTGTIVRTLTVSSFNADHLRVVIDPDEDDSGSATATVWIKPTYKTNYDPPK